MFVSRRTQKKMAAANLHTDSHRPTDDHDNAANVNVGRMARVIFLDADAAKSVDDHVNEFRAPDAFRQRDAN